VKPGSAVQTWVIYLGFRLIFLPWIKIIDSLYNY
jgi:hypothetical protein